MHPVIRKSWPVLAILAGGLLIYFEYRLQNGITGENFFWLFIAALIIILGTIDLLQKRPPKQD